MREPQIGLNDGWTNDEYHEADGVSKSHLDDIAPECLHTPRHYWAKRVDPQRHEREPVEKSDVLIFGDAYHVATLEPDSFHSRFTRPPAGSPKRPTDRQKQAKNPSPATLYAIDFWEDFERSAEGKTVLDTDAFDTALVMRDVLYEHPVIGPYLRRAIPERTYFARDPETGALIKCRLDAELIESDGLILDLKSTVSAHPRMYDRSSTNYRYPVQATWYPHVIHAAYGPGLVQDFGWIAQEKTWPHCAGLYYAKRDTLDEATGMMRRDLRTILACRAREAAGDLHAWPDFVVPGGVELPHRYFRMER